MKRLIWALAAVTLLLGASLLLAPPAYPASFDGRTLLMIFSASALATLTEHRK